jgi:hypothetical protein
MIQVLNKDKKEIIFILCKTINLFRIQEAHQIIQIQKNNKSHQIYVKSKDTQKNIEALCKIMFM